MSPLPGAPPSMADGLDLTGVKAEYSAVGRNRWRMEPPPEDCDVYNYFRFLMPGDIPGFPEGFALPFFYYTHKVAPVQRGKDPKGFNINVYCLGSPAGPAPDGSWPLDPDGVNECLGIHLPGGIPLHNAAEPEQRFLICAYQYNHGHRDVNELRFFDWKVGSEKYGLWGKLKEEWTNQKRGGGTVDNTVWALTRSKQGTYDNYGLKIFRREGEYAERFPFGDQQKQIIAGNAPHFLKWFARDEDRESILRHLDIKGDAGPGPTLPTGTAGPGQTVGAESI